ncbi:MAG: ribonuclease III domain-containing protein [Eubacterium sp.]
MEKSIASCLQKTYTLSEAKMLNPLTLAYIGDGVFSEFIRKYLVAKGLSNVNHLTKESIKYVKADAQSKIILGLMDTLTDEEQTLVKRGRNTHSHPPKNAKTSDYRYATGFETLLGFLNLTGQNERLEALIIKGILLIET